MTISHGLFRQLEEHARSSMEQEVCGFVYGQEYVPLKNCSHTPWLTFEADPSLVSRALWSRGEPDAVFHSHPGGNLQPSALDIWVSYYYNSTMIIGSWAEGRFRVRTTDPTQPEMRNVGTFRQPFG